MITVLKVFSSVFRKVYKIDEVTSYHVAAATNARFPFAYMFFEKDTSPIDLQSLQQVMFTVVKDLLIFFGRLLNIRG